MSSKILSAAIVGLDAELVEVEADISPGLSHFTIVGLPDMAVQESRERVRAAIKNSNLPFPRTRVTVNLAPADLKKEGPSYDLPIAVAILLASHFLKLPEKTAETLGENLELLPGNKSCGQSLLSRNTLCRRIGFGRSGAAGKWNVGDCRRGSGSWPKTLCVPKQMPGKRV